MSQKHFNHDIHTVQSAKWISVVVHCTPLYIPNHIYVDARSDLCWVVGTCNIHLYQFTHFFLNVLI